MSGLDALLAAVYASPDDDVPRVALAAALRARGDVRGEFIALQLAGAPVPYDRAWLGALAPFVEPDVEFARGFPVSAVLSGRVRPSDAIAAGELVEWATFTELDVLRWPQVHVSGVLRRATALRTVIGARASLLPALASLAQLDWLELVQPEPPELALCALPRLRGLRLHFAPQRRDEPVRRWPVDELVPLFPRDLQIDVVTLGQLADWIGLVGAPTRIFDLDSGWTAALATPGELSLSYDREPGGFDLAALQTALRAPPLDRFRAIHLQTTRSLSATERAWLRRTFPNATLDLGGISL